MAYDLGFHGVCVRGRVYAVHLGKRSYSLPDAYQQSLEWAGEKLKLFVDFEVGWAPVDRVECQRVQGGCSVRMDNPQNCPDSTALVLAVHHQRHALRMGVRLARLVLRKSHRVYPRDLVPLNQVVCRIGDGWQ